MSWENCVKRLDCCRNEKGRGPGQSRVEEINQRDFVILGSSRQQRSQFVGGAGSCRSSNWDGWMFFERWRKYEMATSKRLISARLQFASSFVGSFPSEWCMPSQVMPICWWFLVLLDFVAPFFRVRYIGELHASPVQQ